MPNNESTELARRLYLVLSIDDKRAADDPLKLPGALRKDVAEDVKNLADRDALTGTTEGERTEASGMQHRALDELERQLRGGHRFIQALDEEMITDVERDGLFEAYLWKGGQIGRFDHARCLSLARQAIKVEKDNLIKAQWRYPAMRLARIKAQSDIIDGLADTATGGGRQAANRSRDTALDLGTTTLLRVRFWYCSATRDADRTPELARIEYQPRRDYGTVAEAAPIPSMLIPPIPATLTANP
ncbi:MAG: hypothetical protein JWL90_4353 [Chthoniobacteraceae bacterium]|nr:hypothetical protein [Chthoniobacteraceae bacterium]